MTLLVGVLCADGVVLASDRQVTQGALGNQTVGQPGTKVRIVKDNVLFASSGAVSLAQQFQGVIESQHGSIHDGKYHDAVSRLKPLFRAIINPAFETAQRAIAVVGHQAAAADALCSSLLVAKFREEARLVEITAQGEFEYLARDSNGFVCVGSGKQNADPVLRFLWNIYWPETLPTLREGVLAAYWTVKIVTELRSAGVGMGCDVFILEQKHDTKGRVFYSARELGKDELLEHDGFIESAETALRSVRDKITTPTPTEAPPPPTMNDHQ